MDVGERLHVAQALGAPVSAPVQIIKIVKPLAGRTENFYASFDGSVKIDFTAIANEQVRFFHDSENQSLHIVFTDGSQVTIQPFFDSTGVMSNFVFEMAPGQVLDSAQFFSHFRFTTGQGIEPAATEGPPQSGAEVNDPSVDSFPPNTKLALLPPEELPPLASREELHNFAFTNLGALPPPEEPVQQIGALHIEKTADVASVDSTDNVIHYTMVVTNTGNAPIAGVVVDDPLTTNEAPVLSGGFNVGDIDQDDLLDVGESWRFTSSHQVTQADLDSNAEIVNTATATGNGVDPVSDDATVTVTQTRSLNIVKEADVTSVDATGDTITYTYTVTNAGNAAIAGVVVTDDNGTPGNTADDFNPAFTGGDTDGDGLLDVGETWTYTASHQVTQADLDAGADLVNTATATGTGATPDSDDATVTVTQAPASNITEVANDVDRGAPLGDAAGDVITYTITVANTGNTTLTGDRKSDVKAKWIMRVADIVGNNDDNLDVGEIWRFRDTRIVTQADIDTNGGGDGTIDNTATAGSVQTGPDFDSDDASVPVVRTPSLDITKVVHDVDGDTTAPVADAAGDVVTYTITVENTGNTTLTGVTVTDPNADSIVRVADIVGNNDDNLEVGEIWGFEATRIVTQAEIDSSGGGDGTIDNTVTVVSDQTATDTADAFVPMTQGPALNITKVVHDVDGNTTAPVVDAAGNVVTYTIEVANFGNTTLTGVTVTDPDANTIVRGADIVGNNDSNLEVGEIWGFEATRVVTQAEIDSNGGGDGTIDNTATADSDLTGPETADASVPVVQTPPSGEDTTTLALEEEALGPGNPNATGTNPASTAETDFDTLSFTAGSSPLTTFAFSTDLSGLVANTDGVAGNELVWVQDSAEQVTARFGSSAGPVAITLTLTPTAGGSIGDFSTGDVTVTATLSDNLKHALGGGAQVLNLGSVEVIATAADGHFISGTAGVTAKDDVPLPINPQPLVASNVIGTSATAGLDSDGPSNQTGNIDDNIGADHPGAVLFPISLNGVDSGLTSGGIPILYSVSLADRGLVLTGKAAGDTVFTITLNPDGSLASANDTYTLTLSRTVDTNSNIDFNDGIFEFKGGNTPWAAFVPPGQGFGETPVLDGSNDLLLTPAGTAGTTINGSAHAVGIGSGGGGQDIGAGEAMRIDYVNDLTGNPAASASGGFNNPVNRDFAFEGHYVVNGATVSFGDISGPPATARFTAQDDFDGNNDVGDGPVDPITSVAIRFGGQSVVVALAPVPNPHSVTVGGRTFTIDDQADGSVLVSGLVNGATVGTYTADGFNSLVVAYVSGNEFTLAGFGSSSVQDVSVNFNVPVQLMDSDGDVTVGAPLSVTLLPATPPAGAQALDITVNNIDTLDAGAGNNFISGGDGNDTLTGGANGDTIIGGAGNDTITFGGGSNNRAVYAESGPANADTITDYLATSGDVIDLSQLLDAHFGPSSNVADFVRATQTGSNVTVQVDPDGPANGANFSNVVTLSGYGTANPDSVLVHFDGINHTVTA